MIKARFRCHEITVGTSSDKVHLFAVYSSNPASPNHEWAVASPQGELTLTIANPKARGRFKPGQEYELAFTEVDAL